MKFKSTILALAAMMGMTTVKAQLGTANPQPVIDSLKTALESTENIGDKLKTLDELINSIEIEEQIVYAKQMLEIATRVDSTNYIMNGIQYLAYANNAMRNFDEGLKYSLELISFADSIKNIRIRSIGYIFAANDYATLMQKDKSDEYYHKALDGFEESKDTAYIINTNYNIAQNYLDYRMYDRAEEYFNNSLRLSTLVGFGEGMADAHLGLGRTYTERYVTNAIKERDFEMLKKGRDELRMAVKLSRRKIPYSWMTSSALYASNLLQDIDQRTTAERTATLDTCRSMLSVAYQIAGRFGSEADKVRVDEIYLAYLIEKGELKEATEMANTMIETFMEDADKWKQSLATVYSTYQKIHTKLGKYKEALNDLEQSIYWEKEATNENFAVSVANQAAQAEFDEKTRQREIVVKQNQVRMEEKNTRMTIIVVASVLVLILIAILLVQQRKNFHRERKAKEELDMKNHELEQQKEEIIVQNEYLEERRERIERQNEMLEQQNQIISKNNKEIKDSIKYASLIQQAAMPPEETMKNLFGEMLLIYRPLNTVSGDFYWATQVDDVKLLVVADCTGHGVPGAFISILGISLLNSIAGKLDTNNITASYVLDELRLAFKQSLRQKGGEHDNRDGIDMGLLVIDAKKNILQYAGAFRPMIMFRDGEVIKTDADRMPIGSHLKEKEHFTNHIVETKAGDIVYLFSDGMTDQFGYDEKAEVHKFSAKRFISLLTDCHRLPFSAQKEKIELSIDNWRRNGMVAESEEYEQTDDAILVGIKC